MANDLTSILSVTIWLSVNSLDISLISNDGMETYSISLLPIIQLGYLSLTGCPTKINLIPSPISDGLGSCIKKEFLASIERAA